MLEYYWCMYVFVFPGNPDFNLTITTLHSEVSLFYLRIAESCWFSDLSPQNRILCYDNWFLVLQLIYKLNYSDINYVNFHLNCLDSVNKAGEFRKYHHWWKVPWLHWGPVLLVLVQVGTALLTGAPEEFQDLQGGLHSHEALWHLSSQNLFWN